MATCSACGELLRDGVWTCGRCGAPVAGGAGESAPIDLYSDLPPTTTAAAAAPASSGVSSLTKIILLVGLVAVVAIAGLWFFFLRSSGSGPFAGEWKSLTTNTKFTIAAQDGGFRLYMFDSSGKKSAPFAMTANGESLECNLTPAGGDPSTQASNEFARSMLGSITGITDFKLVFTPGSSPGRLIASFGGTAANAQAEKLLQVREEFKRH